MALRKPSDLFDKKPEDLNIPSVESDNSFRDELTKVESLSDQITQLQQELSQKVIQSDLEKLVFSQINSIRENFENLQNDFKKSNKKDISEFKKRVSDVVKNKFDSIDEDVDTFKTKVSTEILSIKTDVAINEQHIKKVDKYLQENYQELVDLKEEVFGEIEKLPVGNIQENLERLEKKIDFIKDTYSKIQPEVIVKEVIGEGLLNEPPNTKNSDPLTPLDQKFVTLDQLQEHYRLFINRIQQQLSTLGGGGETRLKYLDDIVGIATNASAYDGKFLKYDHNIGKFVFDTAGGGAGSQTLNQTLGLGNTSSLGMSVGVITANSYYVGSIQVINSTGQWVGSGLSVYSNIDGGVPNSIYGGIPMIDGGVP